MNEIVIKMKDGLEVYCLYSKIDNPKGVVQIIHGMCEHKERYIELMDKLNKAGYNCIASDLRGHGKSINNEYVFGYTGDYSLLVSDQYEITSFLKKDNPTIPIDIFAHSMGTLIARMYIKDYDNEIRRLILSGTVCYNGGAKLAVLISKMKNKNKSSKLLFAFTNGFSFKEDYSWLSYNKENIENYINDPLCGFRFKNIGYKALFSMVRDLHKLKAFKCQNKALKILMLSGCDDRTTGGTKGLTEVLKTFNKIGYSDIRIKEYYQMKHEIINEDNKADVFVDILQFLGN